MGDSGRNERSQASVLGLAIVFGLVITGSIAIVILGAVAMEDSQATLDVQRAEKAMTQFDSRAGLVALGNTDSQRVDFGAGASSKFGLEEDAGFIRVTRQNLTSGNTTRLVQENMGAIVYDTGRNSISYQGGGVWRRSGSTSVMISPPEFHYRNGTLTLPIIQVGGDLSGGNSVTVSHNETAQKYPDGSVTDQVNPLTNHKVVVTVKSDYYEAWGNYFETRTDGRVTYDHANDIANLTLVSPIDARRVTSATASLSAAGSFEISGSTKGDCNSGDYTDSYNSSASGDYCDQFSAGTTGTNGDIVYGKEVDIDQGSGGDDIRGDVVSGQDVYVKDSSGSGQPYVYGNINYTDNCYGDCSGRITKASATVNQIDGVETARPINTHVTSRVQDIRDSNDNGPPQISGDELDYSSTDVRSLEAGTYYLEEIELNADETLELDTSDGDVVIAVEEEVHLDGGGSSGGTIRVTGDGTAKMYVNGTGVGGSDDHLYVGKNAGIVNPGDDGPQFRLYGKSDLEVAIDGQGSNLAKFVGVVYAPPGDHGTGRVDITGGEVYGGVLTGTTTLDDGSIHYDEALKHQTVVSKSAKIVKVTYLHITTNHIDVSGH